MISAKFSTNPENFNEFGRGRRMDLATSGGMTQHQNGENPSTIFRGLKGAINRAQLFQWCNLIAKTDSIELSKSPGRPHIIRTNLSLIHISEPTRPY